MKKILLFIFLFCFCFSSQASHLMGGEIVWECISDPTDPNYGQYIFTMKVYRDCSGITVSNVAQNLTVWGHPTITGITVDFVSQTDVSPACDDQASQNPLISCLNGDPYAVEEYIFSSQPVDLPGTPPAAGWHFSWSSCCRNMAIVNLQNSSEGFTLRASMYPYTDPSTGLVLPASPCFDSSPIFKERPKTILCIGFPFSYSPNATDAELDSLVYAWGEPLDDDVFSGPVWNPGVTPSILQFSTGPPAYSVTSPLPGNPTLDPATGEISYNSPISGYFVTCVTVQAWKCGQLVAEIFREVQVVLIDCASIPGIVQPVGGVNSPPSITAPFTDVFGNPSYDTIVNAGDFVEFDITGTDNDEYTTNGLPNGTFQELVMDATGGQFSDNYLASGTCLNPPCATFDNGLGITPPNISSDSIVSGFFKWQTSCSHIAAVAGCGATSNVFTFLVKVHDDFCPAYGISIATIKITVVPVPVDQSPDIRCVSVDPIGDTEITWEFLGTESPSTMYKVFHSSNPLGPFALIDSVGYPNNTYLHVGSGANLQSQYYYLTSYSECADESAPSDTLQTIKLDVNAINGGVQGSLDWNPIHDPSLSTSSSNYIIHALKSGIWEVHDSTANLFSVFDARMCNSEQYLFVSLKDQSGCISNSSIDSDILKDTISPAVPVISDVSVNSNGKAVISWTSSPIDVEMFVIYWQDPTGAWITIDTVFDASITSYIFNNSDANHLSETYRIRALDSCFIQSSTSIVHHSINLEHEINICSYSMNFFWNEYINFTGGLSHYKVFIEEKDILGNITNNIIGRLSSSNQEFLFNGIQEGYQYYVYVEAYNIDSTLVATSDQENIIIDLPDKPRYNYVEYATVLQDSDELGNIEVSCVIDNQAIIDHYLIYRSERNDSIFSQIASVPFPGIGQTRITYIDRDVETDKHFYEYQIYPIDTCGAVSPAGSFYDIITDVTNSDTSFARTMLLNVETNLNYASGFPNGIKTTNSAEYVGDERSQYTNTITFNEGDKFFAHNNIEFYKLYRSIDNNPFDLQSIYTWQRNDEPLVPLKYIDVVTPFGNTKGKFCYYIEAIEGLNNPHIGGPVPSGVVFSNIICIYQTPVLFIPNSFTPDGKGPLENELFIPQRYFVSDQGYSLVIYNRQGVELFRTNNPQKGWDGTHMGNNLPTGTYIYHLQYINGSGILVNTSDAILLIR